MSAFRAVLQVDAKDQDIAVAVLRTMYGVRNLQESDPAASITIQAAQPILAASEALVRELGLLKQA